MAFKYHSGQIIKLKASSLAAIALAIGLIRFYETPHVIAPVARIRAAPSTCVPPVGINQVQGEWKDPLLSKIIVASS